MTFERYLQHKFQEIFISSSLNGYENWLENLSTNELIEYAQLWMESFKKELLKEVAEVHTILSTALTQ